MRRVPEDRSSGKLGSNDLYNTARYEFSQGTKIVLQFNGEIMYVLKNLIKYSIFIKVLILQDSEGHGRVFVGVAVLVNQS